MVDILMSVPPLLVCQPDVAGQIAARQRESHRGVRQMLALISQTFAANAAHTVVGTATALHLSICQHVGQTWPLVEPVGVTSTKSVSRAPPPPPPEPIPRALRKLLVHRPTLTSHVRQAVFSADYLVGTDDNIFRHLLRVGVSVGAACRELIEEGLADVASVDLWGDAATAA